MKVCDVHIHSNYIDHIQLFKPGFGCSFLGSLQAFRHPHHKCQSPSEVIRVLKEVMLMHTCCSTVKQPDNNRKSSTFSRLSLKKTVPCCRHQTVQNNQNELYLEKKVEVCHSREQLEQKYRQECDDIELRAGDCISAVLLRGVMLCC